MGIARASSGDGRVVQVMWTRMVSGSASDTTRTKHEGPLIRSLCVGFILGVVNEARISMARCVRLLDRTMFSAVCSGHLQAANTKTAIRHNCAGRSASHWTARRRWSACERSRRGKRACKSSRSSVGPTATASSRSPAMRPRPSSRAG
eukprot:3513014-Rhodomonas_salina.2